MPMQPFGQMVFVDSAPRGTKMRFEMESAATECAPGTNGTASSKVSVSAWMMPSDVGTLVCNINNRDALVTCRNVRHEAVLRRARQAW